MPSPIGHAAAGLIVALAGEKKQQTFSWVFIAICIFLAASPDLDWLIPDFHRGPTHGIGFSILVTLVASGVTERASGKANWRIALICGLAYSSHIFMDWLGEEPEVSAGVAALWPFSGRMFIAGLNVFHSTQRVDAFVSPQFEHNLMTLAREILILAPILLVLLWRRHKRAQTSEGAHRPWPRSGQFVHGCAGAGQSLRTRPESGRAG